MTTYQGHSPATLSGETAERFRTYRALGLSEAAALRGAVDDDLRESNAIRAASVLGGPAGPSGPVSERQADLIAAPYRRDDPFEQLVRTYEAFDNRSTTATERRARATRAVLAEYGSEQAVRDMFAAPAATSSGRTEAHWAQVHEAARLAGVIASGEQAWGNDDVTAFERQVAEAEARGLPLGQALTETTRAVRAGDVQLQEATTPAPGPASERAPAPAADPPAPADAELREANATRAQSMFRTREDA